LEKLEKWASGTKTEHACVFVCRRFDDPEPFDVSARRGDVDLYQQHPSSEPQLRRVQSRSRLETQQLADDVFVSSR